MLSRNLRLHKWRYFIKLKTEQPVISNSLTYILVLLGSVKSGEFTKGFAQGRHEQNKALIKVMLMISPGRSWLTSSVLFIER
jgi:hypothetical protein